MADNITSGPMITELEISTDLRELNILENDTPVLPLSRLMNPRPLSRPSPRKTRL